MPRNRKILILGGTREGRLLADRLADAGHSVITSLAGVTAEPPGRSGTVVRGGFGGVAGLVRFLAAERIDAIADATHPYAARMAVHAVEAARQAGVPCVRLERSAWVPGPLDDWNGVADAEEAARLLPAGARVFAAIGRKDIAPLFARGGIGGVARMIEAPEPDVPPAWTLLRARPPFEVSSEKELMAAHGITWMVAKNSGGDDNFAKFVAARECGVRVLMLRRPPKPEAPCRETIDALVQLLRQTLLP